MPARRTVLRQLAGAALVPVAGGAAWTLTRDPAAARAPWRAAGSTGDARLDALSYAVLSANPHNRQPWLVTLPAAEEIVLHVDLERLLPMTDPFGRQIVIGLGCFLETLAIAAAAQGRTAEVTLFPEGSDPRALDARPVARIRLVEGAARDPLFDAIPARRSCKEPFEARRPSAAAPPPPRSPRSRPPGRGCTRSRSSSPRCATSGPGRMRWRCSPRGRSRSPST
ncbi:MAG: hypothetical protein R6V44_07715 [Paracoccaceae bacterium]